MNICPICRKPNKREGSSKYCSGDCKIEADKLRRQGLTNIDDILKYRQEKMKQSIYQKKKNKLLKNKARKLYREGLSLRQVGKVINRSYQWVANNIDKT